MRSTRLGDVQVGAIGLGGMPMSVRQHNDEEQALATIRAALQAGVTLIDTADAYCPDEGPFGHNEELIAKALREFAGEAHGQVVVATKGGHTRDGADWGLDGRPEYLRSAAQDSARRLGVEQIDLYQHHRPDPAVPYDETMGALKELVDEGLVARAGISNADPDQIRTAHGILGDALVAVQNQFSPAFRSSEPEIELCDELGLAFLAWSPLGGMSGAADLGGRHGAFAQVAQAHGVSPQQVCLAWELAVSGAVLPIPGASRPESITDSVAAVDLELTAEEIATLSAG